MKWIKKFESYKIEYPDINLSEEIINYIKKYKRNRIKKKNKLDKKISIN